MPSCSPTPKTGTMLVWCSLAADFASRSNRRLAWASSSMFLGSTLRRHVTAQRDLLGLVDDAHAALADLAEDAEIAKLPQSREPPGRAACSAAS